ncbi:hypothetical protein M1N17_02765 [Dehalococcoidia bacterium]|nr:hypothetical protein [Dehalococcoidia bacterium]
MAKPKSGAVAKVFVLLIAGYSEITKGKVRARVMEVGIGLNYFKMFIVNYD